MDTVKSQMEILSVDSQGQVNYVSWKFKLNLTLRQKNLYDVAYGITVRPTGVETLADVIDWIKKDQDAQTFIGMNVGSIIAVKIAKCKSAHQMIAKLESLYGKRSDVTLEGLQQAFFNYKYDDSVSIVENCQNIQQIADDISAESEDEVKESWIMTRILGMLPQKLHHFRTSWDNVVGVDKCLTTMFERLRVEEDRIKKDQEQDDVNSHTALMSKQTRSDGNNNNGSGECFKCGQKGHFKRYCKNKPTDKYLEYCKNKYGCKLCKEKGHFARECKKKIKSEKDENGKDENRRALITIGLSATKSSNFKMDSWYQDCAATQHMTSHRGWLTNYVSLENPSLVIIGNGESLEGMGIGDVNLEAFNGEKWEQIVLKNVLYVPNMPFNLFSVVQILDKGYVQSSNAEKSYFTTQDGKETVAISVRDKDLFKMMFRQEKDENSLIVTSIRTWHKRLAHQNIQYVRDILKKNNIKYVDDWDDYVCVGCIYGKQHCKPHPKNPKVSEKVLDLVHVDLGEMSNVSLGGNKYFLVFKDDYSHFRSVYFLKTKDEAVEKLDIFLKMVSNQFERNVKRLQSDQGTEIKNKNSRRLCEELGILHTNSNARSPAENGRVEREMRTIVEAARTAIHTQDLNENLWAEAINYAVFTLNQTGKSTVMGKSPADLWFGRKVNIECLKSFGCDAYVLIPKHQRSKSGKKAKKGIFVGYDLDSPCYRIYFVEDGNIISSDNVSFDETSDNGNGYTEINLSQSEYKNEDSGGEEKIFDNEDSQNSSSENEYESVDSESEEIGVVEEVRNIETPQPERRSLRSRDKLKMPAKFADYVLNSKRSAIIALISEIQDITISEALQDRNWKKAMAEEYKSLIKMRTWDLVEVPPDVQPLTCRWILSKKQAGRLKARLVIRGFEQKAEFDFAETFSPVAQYTSIRLILSHAASKGMKIWTFDIKTAFLHGNITELVYMYQPQGFDDGSGRVCKLNKSLYGLKKAPKNWNKRFSDFLKSIDFECTDDDPCIYYNKNRSIIITIFVDDGCIVGYNSEDILKVLNEINRNFEATYDVKWNEHQHYLGMEIRKCQDGIVINQSSYTKKILKMFDFDYVNDVETPMEKGMITKEENYKNNCQLEKSIPYREAIGSLLYLSTITRPDISFSVNYLSRFTSKPMTSHWKMVRRIFQYLKGTVNYGIHFNGDDKLIAYTDSDYGGDLITGQSTSGVLIMYGGPIVWYAQKQRLVATSSAEAEYRAAVSAIDDICWIRRLGSELKFIDMEAPTPLLIDNWSAIHMLQNSNEGKISKGKKHIEIARKFIQEHIGKTVKLQRIKTSEQLADVFTKALDKRLLIQIRRKIIKEECCK